MLFFVGFTIFSPLYIIFCRFDDHKIYDWKSPRLTKSAIYSDSLKKAHVVLVRNVLHFIMNKHVQIFNDPSLCGRFTRWFSRSALLSYMKCPFSQKQRKLNFDLHLANNIEQIHANISLTNIYLS